MKGPGRLLPDIAVAVTEMIRIPFAGRGSVNLPRPRARNWLRAAGRLAFWHMFLTAVGRIRHPGERGDRRPQVERAII